LTVASGLINSHLGVRGHLLRIRDILADYSAANLDEAGNIRRFYHPDAPPLMHSEISAGHWSSWSGTVHHAIRAHMGAGATEPYLPRTRRSRRWFDQQAADSMKCDTGPP
jgi:hypothetical protein